MEVLTEGVCLTQQLNPGYYNLHGFPVPKRRLKQVKKIRGLQLCFCTGNSETIFLCKEALWQAGRQIKGELIYFER